MKWRRFKRKNGNFKAIFLKIAIIGLLILIPISAVVIIRSNIFNIQIIDLHTQNIGCVSNEQIKNSSNILGQHLFLINSKKVETELKKKFICINSVVTSKIFPNKLRLDVFGRTPAAILVVSRDKEASGEGILEQFTRVESTNSATASASAMVVFTGLGQGESYLIDNEGVLYSKNIEYINSPKVYKNDLDLALGQKLEGNLTSNLIKVLEKLRILNLDFDEAKIYSKKVLLINSVPIVLFVLDKGIENQIASLQLILKKAKIDQVSLEFIDLRFDKPIVRFAPKK